MSPAERTAIMAELPLRLGIVRSAPTAVKAE